MYEERLRQKGITLPEPPRPIGTYLPAVRSGDILFVSGMIPKIAGQTSPKGKIGRELTSREGYDAARLCALNTLAVAKTELGSLDKISRVLKVVGYVASGEAFADQSVVVNGASDLLVDIFGDKGKHARVSVGVAELPGNVPVEIEVTFEVKSSEREGEPKADRFQEDLLKTAEKKRKAKTRSRGPYRKAAVA
ncbi:MAG: RidA family protein [Nitrososphaerales archaeon]